jgi:hypothetical protein
LDKLRLRGGHIILDRAKYDTQEKRRELVRRERTIELAGEGMRRADILRWRDASGKMVAETVLNQPVLRWTGTVDFDEPDPDMRATIKPTPEVVQNRKFEPHHRYLPFPQAQMDRNPNLIQNDGYN